MSKGIIISIALFAIVIIVAITGQFYLTSTMTDLNKDILSAQIHFKDNNIEAAKSDIKKFKTGFEKSSPILKLYIRHQELEVITINSSPLESILETGQKGDFMKECDKLSAQLKHIIQSEEISVENIV